MALQALGLGVWGWLSIWHEVVNLLYMEHGGMSIVITPRSENTMRSLCPNRMYHTRTILHVACVLRGAIYAYEWRSKSLVLHGV